MQIYQTINANIVTHRREVLARANCFGSKWTIKKVSHGILFSRTTWEIVGFNPNLVGLLGVRFAVWNLKLEIFYVSTHTYLVLENIPFRCQLFFFFFFSKNEHFLSKIVPLFKAIVWELCQRLFSSVFSFCKIKGYF